MADDTAPQQTPSDTPGSRSHSTTTQTSHSVDPANKPTVSSTAVENLGPSQNDTQSLTPPVYCALLPGRRRLILSIVTVAGALGPLSGGIYLPVLPLLEREFNVGSTSINATVSVFMITFAIAVSLPFLGRGMRKQKCSLLTCLNSHYFGLALRMSVEGDHST